MRKIILYPQSAMKPIILSTTSTEDIEKLKTQIMEVLSGTKISILQTETDTLIIRPSEIQAVLITEKEYQDNDKSKHDYESSLQIQKPQVKK